MRNTNVKLTLVISILALGLGMVGCGKQAVVNENVNAKEPVIVGRGHWGDSAIETVIYDAPYIFQGDGFEVTVPDGWEIDARYKSVLGLEKQDLEYGGKKFWVKMAIVNTDIYKSYEDWADYYLENNQVENKEVIINGKKIDAFYSKANDIGGGNSYYLYFHSQGNHGVVVNIYLDLYNNELDVIPLEIIRIIESIKIK